MNLFYGLILLFFLLSCQGKRNEAGTYKANHPGHFRKLVTVFCNTEKGMLRLMVTGEALCKEVSASPLIP